MKAIPLIVLLLYLLLSCTSRQKQFQDFDPLKKALASNNVVAYVTYLIDNNGKRLKADTVVVDSNGNEIKRWVGASTRIEKKFDSLDRLVSVYQVGHVRYFERFEYETLFENVAIIHEFVGASPTDSVELMSTTTIEYDDAGLPIKQTLRNLHNSKSETYEFQYDNGRIVMEKLISEEYTDHTEYKYINDRLFSKTRIRGVAMRDSYVDYFSADTGLRDSSNTFEGDILVLRKQYKYYFYK
jgi:hypothetical protein